VREFGLLFLLVSVLAVVLGQRFVSRGPRGQLASGTLMVTGVSPRPDASGEQYVTIAGVINGPTVNSFGRVGPQTSEWAVYQRMVVDVDHWPTIGQLLPVVYSPKNPDNWRLAPAEPPAA
jgi:hypothetical protein